MVNKRILITGANGLIASLLRPLFIGESVVLVSRRPVDDTNQNERNIICEDISTIEWRNDVLIKPGFDMIFHLAEFMDGSVDLDVAVNAHICFLDWACNASPAVIYPLTAYLYDRKKQTSKYVEIKKNVMGKMMDKEVMYFPVIHPLTDAGTGLGNQIALINKFAPFNFFSAFNAKMYVLNSQDVNRIIPNVESGSRLYDVYSDHLSISEIFFSDKKISLNWISYLLYLVCRLTPLTNSRDVLVHGRKIHRSAIFR